MSSIKLTNAMKDGIAEKLLHHRFSVEAEKLLNDTIEFYEVIYDCLYPKKVQDSMTTLPSGWLPERQTSSGSIANEKGFNREYFYWGEMPAVLKKFVPRPVGLKKIFLHEQHSNGIHLQNDELLQKYLVWKHNLSNFNDDVRETRIKTLASLNCATTLGKLLDAWPEIAPFCQHLKSTKKQLPMLSVSSLNNILNLPIKGE